MAEEVKKPGDPVEPQVVDPQIEAAEAVEKVAGKDEGAQPEAIVIDEIVQTDESEAKATPAAEAAPVQIPQEVAVVGVAPKEEGAKEILKNHPTGDIEPAGEHHPVHAVDGSNVTLPGQEKTKEIFPPIMESSEFGKGNSLPLHKLAWQRAKQLLFGRGLKDPQDSTMPSTVIPLNQPPNNGNPVLAQDKKAA